MIDIILGRTFKVLGKSFFIANISAVALIKKQMAVIICIDIQLRLILVKAGIVNIQPIRSRTLINNTIIVKIQAIRRRLRIKTVETECKFFIGSSWFAVLEKTMRKIRT
jgi:hypothetical protein